MFVEITIGETNYSGVACGFTFVRSVAIEEVDSEEDPKIMRLMLLFPKSRFKVLKSKGQKAPAEASQTEQPSSPAKEADDGESDPEEGGDVSPEEDAPEDSQEADAPGTGSEGSSEGSEESGEGSPSEAEAGEEAPETTGEAGEEEAETGGEGETEEGESEDADVLKKGDSVVVEFQDEMRTGIVVSIMSGGAVRVKIDDDDANYRVLDDDKVKPV